MLPIVAYGHPTLKKVAVDIDKDYEDLEELIAKMWETMYHSQGVGLAAPQINTGIRLFVIDASPFEEDYPETKDFKKVFINAHIVEESGEEWYFNEGCLSVPDVREDVLRKPKIRIQYFDQDWVYHEDEFDGIVARVIQHEYDHLDGMLFVDRLSNLRKMMLKKKLTDITKGNISVDYRMIFPKIKRGRK
ncbi:MAG: peptide deformylase [Bacteroidales bacterium]|nr:peptide deformylase [Bacteroidales bacterium]